MKKTFILLFVLSTLCVGIFSCSTDNPSDEGNNPPSAKDKELIPVSFNVGFTKDVTGFRSSTAVNLYDFYYLVYKLLDSVRYDINGTPLGPAATLYKKLQFRNFTGVINDTLPAGDYDFIFVGATEEAGISFYGGISDLSFFQYATVSPLLFCNIGVNANCDVFSKELNYSVALGSANDNSVALDRIVGRVKIVIQDTIPSDVIQIGTQISTIPKAYLFGFGGGGGLTSATGGAGFDIGTINLYPEPFDRTAGFTCYFTAFENFSSPQNRVRVPFSITLTAFNVSGHMPSPFISKVISNVDVLKNQTVIYTGKLFDPSPSSFTTTLNDQWGDTINKPF